MAIDDVVRGYAEGLFRVVTAERNLELVENELFHFAKLLESEHELKQALSDQSIDRIRRQKILDDVLADKVSTHTLGLLSFVVAQGRARHLPQILEQLSSLAAEARNSVVAEVRSAIPLDDDQRARLADALSHATGKKVAVKVVVDPSVIGGVVARVGDTVIDGSIRRRLEQAKEQLTR